jgi:hypothetical protein
MFISGSEIPQTMECSRLHLLQTQPALLKTEVFRSQSERLIRSVGRAHQRLAASLF